MRPRLMHKKVELTVFLAIVFVLSVVGCASVDEEAARKKLGSAESTINLAQANEATQHAPLELRMAQEKLSQANYAFNENEFIEAQWRADEALADAKLADAKAETVETRKTVETLRKSIDDLKKQIKQQQTQ